MFDQDDEDKDLESQVSKGHSPDENAGLHENHYEPESVKGQHTRDTPEAMDTSDPFESPSSNTTEKSTTEDPPPPYVRAAGDSDIPTKLTTLSQEKA